MKTWVYHPTVLIWIWFVWVNEIIHSMSSRWKIWFWPIRSWLSYRDTRAEPYSISISLCFRLWRIPSIWIHFCPKMVIFESTPKVVARLRRWAGDWQQLQTVWVMWRTKTQKIHSETHQIDPWKCQSELWRMWPPTELRDQVVISHGKSPWWKWCWRGGVFILWEKIQRESKSSLPWNHCTQGRSSKWVQMRFVS